MEAYELEKTLIELQTGNDRQRRAASYKLGKVQDPIVVQALIDAFSDQDVTVRQNIIDGLLTIGTPEAKEFLTQLKMKELAARELEPVQTTVKTASNGRRFANFLIDTIIYIVFMIYIIGPLSRRIMTYFDDNFWVSFLIAIIELFLYYFIFEYFFQKTPAKFITRTKVVKENGSKPDAKAIVLRTLARFVPGDSMSFYSGKDPNLKGTIWHDRWNSTRVIQG